jgi:hypothetical protein
MGKRYGWPFIYENGKMISHPLPPPAYTREDWRKMSQNPLLMHTAHSAGIRCVLHGQPISRRISQRCFHRAARLVES